MPVSAAEMLKNNLARLRERVESACGRAGRDPAGVQLVVVTKSVGMDVIETLRSLGVRDLGENRVQQLVERASALATSELANGPGPEASGREAPRWHMIGHLQRNKVKLLVPHCRILHSLDSHRLAVELDACAARLDSAIGVYLEVNVSGEATKGGVGPDEAAPLAEAVQRLSQLRLRGLMTMAPFNADAEKSRPHFARLRQFLESLRAHGAVPRDCAGLSMGMSQDYAVAVEEGATVVRVGSALFEGIEAD